MSDRVVFQNEDGNWVNKRVELKRASSVHETQKQAEDAAREMLRNQGGGELTTQGRDGKFRSKDTISPWNRTINVRGIKPDSFSEAQASRALESAHVIPIKKRWKVAFVSGKESPSFPTKEEAVTYARMYLKGRRTEILTHRRDGKIVSRESFKAANRGHSIGSSR
jgi:hypothetical protein